MKVFISWSGEQSRQIAICLKEWLPMVIQVAKPWVSDQDIAAGARWSSEVAKELADTNFGIICLTPDNLEKPWILFEAGALAKSLEHARVVPLVYDLELSAVKPPLSMFQAKKLDQAGMIHTVGSINKALGEQAPFASQDKLAKQCTALWPDLEQDLKQLALPPAISTPPRRSTEDILEEVLSRTRALDGLFVDVQQIKSMLRVGRAAFRLHWISLGEIDEVEGQQVAAVINAETPHRVRGVRMRNKNCEIAVDSKEDGGVDINLVRFAKEVSNRIHSENLMS